MKIRLISFISILFLMFCLVVKAEEINALYTKSPLTVVDNKITLKLYVNTEHDISGAIFPWSFDQNKLKLVSVKSSNFNVTYKDLNNNLTRNIVLDSANDYNGEVELVEIVFEPTSEFNESDIASIRFGSGQIASYKKSSNITGLEFKALKEEEKIEMTYSVVPIVTTLENSGKDGSLALLDSGTSSKAKKKTGAIKAEKTGIGVPGYAIILLLGGIVITRKNKSIMYRV